MSKFGKHEWSPEEKSTIQSLLEVKLPVDHISSRPGTGGAKVSYIESWKAIELANAIFGYNGWSSSIVDITPDFIDQEAGKYRVGITAVVKVTLRDGTFHEDVGYGTHENRNKALAIENAKKEAVSDARKRALRVFGNALGNSVYDRIHVGQEVKQKKSNNLLSSPISYDGLRNSLKLDSMRRGAKNDPKMDLECLADQDQFIQTNLLEISSKASSIKTLDRIDVQFHSLKGRQENNSMNNTFSTNCTNFEFNTDPVDHLSKPIQLQPSLAPFEKVVVCDQGEAPPVRAKCSKYDAVASTMEFIKEDMVFDFGR
ncbi:uncharacterized protein LOC126324548 [Schistocerca gregaria]|uniref:uncharacterized protein LOC126324548 n=1 Tax=Schistocerca gregaria TaxID=7010 RepID=UPI00211E5381|nr:uncharacterized protein LOC126324548 [Schistocerca gregaria]